MPARGSVSGWCACCDDATSCLSGGKIAVNTGLIPVAQTADALAVVMGHEISHALLRHGAERMAQQHLAQGLTIATGLAAGSMDPQ